MILFCYFSVFFMFVYSAVFMCLSVMFQPMTWRINLGALKSRDLTRRHHIARVDIARPDNPAPCPLRWFRIPSVLRLDVEENDWTVRESVPTSTTAGAAIRTDVCDGGLFEEASVAGFFLDNRLCQITVQTFSIITATFPSANTYLCCWRCLLVNNIWLYDCALTGALSCFIERRRTVNEYVAVDSVCSWIIYEYMTMLLTLLLTVFARP